MSSDGSRADASIRSDMAINTKRVPDRRKLRFESIAELRAEIDRVLKADETGRLKRLGNWTAGQNLFHIAAWINYAYDGFPAEIKRPPWAMRVLLKMLKGRMLSRGLPVGFRLPGVAAGTLGIDDVPTHEGHRLLTAALNRLESQPPPLPSPALGPLTHPEWIALHLRHAELHLGFLMPV